MSAVPFTSIDKLYIAGRWQTADAREAVLNPATEAVIGNAPLGETAATRAAIDAARDAFDEGSWPGLKMAERAEILSRMHAVLVAKRDLIAQLIVAEVGCAQGITHAMQVGAPLDHFKSAIEHSARDDRS